MNHPPRSLPFAVLAAAFLFLPSAFLLSQGPLTPPGAPAAVMKTLAQIEPRTDLQAPTLPPGVTTDASYHFIIGQPGSYYLSVNLGITKTNGILINAEGVTLDLNGFQISRASGTGGNGIEISGTSHRAAVRNGSLKGLAYGIRSLLAATYARGCAFRDLAVSGCTTYGILAGEGAMLEACRAHDNSGGGAYGIYAHSGSTLSRCTAAGNTVSRGIHAGTGSTLSHCTAANNTASYGIYADYGSTLSHCTGSNNTGSFGIYAEVGSTLSHCVAHGNQSNTTSSGGIGTADGCVLRHCTAYNNTSTAATPTATTGMGFNVGTASTIEGCTAYVNKGDGIKLSGATLARANTCVSNGFGAGLGAGIHTTSADNRLESNNVATNDLGIDVDVAGSIILKNSATGNGSNYEIAAGNAVGAIVVPAASGAISGNGAVASSLGSTDPWANFSY